MRHISSVLVLLLCPAVLLAQDESPKAVITAPDSVEIGEILEFDASESAGENFTWQVHPYGASSEDLEKLQRIKEIITYLEGENFEVIGPKGAMASDYRVYDEGLKLVVPSKPGRRYAVFLAVSDADGRIDSAMKFAEVEGYVPPPPPPPDPGPEPGPDPGPNPPPVVNPFLQTLAPKVSGWAAAYPVEQRQAVAKVFEDEADQNHATASSMTTETSEGMKAALGNNYASWLLFRQNLAMELNSLRQSGQLPETNLQVHDLAWKAIAAGLRS